MIFLVVIAAMYGLMAATHSWSPRLGLDLKGGTTITLTARTSDGKAPSSANLEQARNIIQQRVNSLGVGESSVKTSGDRNIVVSAPNVNSDKLLEMVGQTAQLGFRFVYAEQQVQATPSASGSAGSTAQAPAPSGLPPAPSPVVPTATGLPSAPASSKASAKTYSPTDAGAQANQVKAAQAWQPTEADQQAFTDHKCGQNVTAQDGDALVTCNREGNMKFLLSPVALPGTLVTKATAGIPEGNVSYVVNLTFNSIGATSFGTATTYLCSKQSPQNQFAVVLDGKVISYPQLDGNKGTSCPITTGQAEISGSFTQQSADELASILKYGALPLSFTASSVDTVSPTLGGEQLRVGLIAGLVGLLLVAAYCIIYYRGLGLVVISSLLIAGAFTYAAVVLLGDSMGFTLSLAGVAGAIVAIGITADSFIVYFERIRDEIREGRTLRTSLSTGWRKARGTIAMADGVQLLSAVILFILSVDQVKGFAFTLGLTTAIDLLICFFFTHPIMLVLGRTKFWGRGRRGSGLEPAHMGVSEAQLLGRRAHRLASTTAHLDQKEA
ncbi:MAG: protein translocase subunit SecD [Acidipropionibacterium jensenii]|uniref:protein translocase subunit SecD n=1 Tax=Acidipropionibacterium jensenii TaxID=1749 RepID=UPI0026493BD1|nr:protein translocase subunit SecD [Acidipropionibacterium jensenii]MDN6512696.1 protein translocase subunit SecD [Acidipropionibacterium jensenii]